MGKEARRNESKKLGTACDYQPTVSGAWQWVGKGSNVKGVSSGQCTVGVKSAQTTYQG